MNAESVYPEAYEMPDGVDRCPACGRFVSIDDSYGAPPPGGDEFDYVASYCDQGCADRIRGSL